MNERVLQLRVGFLVLATLLIAGILLVLFNEPGALLPVLAPGGKYTVRVRFTQAPNVAENTPVRKSGILIGRVSEVDLLDEGGVVVTARIDGNRRLRHNEVFRVVNDLLGDAVVDVVPSGDPAAPDTFIEGGETLNGEVIPSPVQVLQNLDQKLSKVIDSVSNAGQSLAVASNDLGEAARHVTDLLERNKDKMEDALIQAQSTLQAVEKAADSARQLLGDEQTQKDLKEAMARLPDIVVGVHETIQNMRGTMALVDRNLQNVERFTQALGNEEMIERLNRGTKSLESLLSDMAQFSGALNDESGSLGKFVHDRELYDHLNRAAQNIDQLTRQLKPIVADVRVFTDKIARHPSELGVRGALQRSPGIK